MKHQATPSGEHIALHGYITGQGQHFTRKDTVTPYDIGNWDQLWQLAANPPQLPKLNGHWAIFSTYNNPDARSLQPQRERGAYTALWVDIDHGDPAQSTVAVALRKALGPAAFLIYNSVSTGETRAAPSEYVDRQTGEVLYTDQAGTQKLKHRVIIPLAQSISAFDFVVHQFALNNFLLHEGLFPDFVSCGPVQLCFLPNRGVRYDPPHFEQGQLFNPAISPLAPVVEFYRGEFTRQTIHSRPTHKQEGRRSYIAAFRRAHPSEQVLIDCGFTSRDGGMNWHHPHQDGPSFATKLYEDGGIYTLSSTVGAWGGHPDGNGWYFGDGYNLYQHFFYPGDQMEAYARSLLTKEDKEQADFVEHGKQIWEGLENIDGRPHSQRAKAQWREENPLPMIGELKPNGPAFTNMPEPPSGPIFDISCWLYSDMMIDPQRDLAILLAWMLAAAFSGRKDSLKKNPPVVQARVLALNGVGKDTLNKAHGMILSELAVDEEFSISAKLFEDVKTSFGTKRMIQDDLNRLSNVRIINEAGIAGASKAGDRASVRAAIMQNFAQDAYSRRTYPGHAERLPSPYGVNTSVYEESTKETFLDLMSGQLGSGEAARMLSFRIDASAVGYARLHDDKLIPQQIMDIFRKLAREALRAEALTVKYDDMPAPAMLPVPDEQRRRFELSEGAEVRLKELLAERTAFKRSNTENEASLEWAQRVRYEQLVLRLALVHARTRIICGPNPYSAPVVELGDLQAAEALVQESRRTERANGGDYDDPISRLTKTMYEYCIKELTRPEQSKTYARKHKHGEFEQRIMCSAMFTGGTCAPHTAAKALLDSGRYGQSPAEVLYKAAVEGEAQGLWEVEKHDRRWRLKGIRNVDG